MNPLDNLPEDPEVQEKMAQVFEWFQGNVQRIEEAYQHLEKRFQEVHQELMVKTEELEKATQQNERIQENLNTLLNSMKPGVVMVDAANKITVVNQSAEKLLGVDSKNLEGQYIVSAFAPDHAFLQVLTRAKENPLEMVELDRRITTENGGFPAALKGSAIVGYEEQVIGVVVTFSDLTSLKKMEEEVQQHRILSAMGEMAATVAHEIRNPLGGIGGYAGLLARDIPPEDDRRRLVDKIIQGVSSLNKIVSNLLYYTRKTETRPVPLDLVDFVNGVLSFVEIEVEKSGKQIELKREFPKEPLEVELDPEKMQQVLLNLLLNALQAIEGSGEIAVTMSLHGDQVELKIQDTGSGMSEETKEQIFNPFFTTKEQGTGLGLAIVKKIIDLHHGQLSVESALDEGTSFLITLPR